MKKLLLTSLLSIFVLPNINSQIVITIPDDNTNYAGGTIILNADPSNEDILLSGSMPFDLILHNNTGMQKTWRVTQKKIGIPLTWKNMFCTTRSEADPTIAGNCWMIDFGAPDIFITPANKIKVNDNESDSLLIHYTFDQTTANSGLYRYYIGDGLTYEDSVDVQINFTLGLNEKSNPSTFSIFPNPSNDKVSIQLNNNEIANLKIVDVLGNIIYKEEINSTSDINVSEFKNGIYFVTIETNGIQSQMEKLIVKY